MKHFLLFIMCLVSSTAFGIGVERVEPANWWVGMKNHELQYMVKVLLTPTFLSSIQACI